MTQRFSMVRPARVVALVMVGLVSALMVQANVQAQESKSPAAGNWVGELDLGQIALTLVLKVEADDAGNLKGGFGSPDQGPGFREVPTISFTKTELRFEIPQINAIFEGKMSQDGNSIEGTFVQNGRRTPVTWKRTASADLPKPPVAPDELKGVWEGPIEVGGGIQLRVALRIEPSEANEGNLTPYFDSIDQNVKGIPVSAISFKDGKLKFEVKTIAGSFEGALSDDGTKVEGTWKQGQSMKLTLTRSDEVSSLERPQHPEPPFPYVVEELVFENPEAGITLAGTLTMPEGEGPFPGAVMISGSGPQDRDETLMGHKPFLVVADHLTRNGVAVLRYDDRGTAKSSGDHSTATSDDFATDALAAARFLEERPEVDASAVGLIGHSEGGLIAPMAAAVAPDEIDYIILMAGTGVTGAEILKRQRYLIAKDTGASEEDLQSQEEVLDKLMEIIEKSEDPETKDRQIAALIAEIKESLDEEDLKEIAEAGTTLEEGIKQTAAQLSTPWFGYFLTFDPATALEQVACPVFAFWGSKDLQVDPEQNAEPVERALESAPTDDVTIIVFEGLNHLFQHSKTGSLSEYGTNTETFAPEVLESMSTWLLERFGAE